MSALADIGLHPREFAVMNVIEADPGQTQQGIALASDTDPSTMVATLDALEERGLAERRPHPDDRRKRAVHLTAKGKRTLARGRELADKVGEETFAPLDEQERAELNALLRKLAGLDDRV
jgi:DNA-binding MarR family transcriptional regulator